MPTYIIYMRKPIASIILIIAFGIGLLQPVQAQVHKKPTSAATPPIQLNAFNINKWLGVWERRIWLEGANFDIQQISGNSFAFNFDVQNGGLYWQAKGRAYLQDNHTAVFSSPLYAGCKLTIHLLSDSIIQIEGSKCDAYGGKGVSYTGRFVNNKYLPPKTHTTMISLHVFNKQQDNSFRSLVGNSYNAFVNSTQHIREEKPQKPGMRIFSSTLTGFLGQVGYMMMIDNSNHIWTAILDGGVNVLYFTNTADKKALPQPIKHWISSLPRKYTITYLSK